MDVSDAARLLLDVVFPTFSIVPDRFLGVGVQYAMSICCHRPTAHYSNYYNEVRLTRATVSFNTVFRNSSTVRGS